MAKTQKKSFILYTDYGKYFERLSLTERGQLITALFAYQSEGTEPEELSPAAGMAFCFMRDQFDRDNVKYDERTERSRENGKKGGRSKANQTQWVSEEPNKTQWVSEEPNKTQWVSEKPNKTQWVSEEPNKTQWVSEKPNKTLNDTDHETVTENENETLSSPAPPPAALADAAPPDSVVSPLKVRISSAQLEDEFERIWKIYPRKEGKKGARAAFEKVRRRGVSFEQIEAGAKRYAEVAGQREMKYIKHGSTWFAGECWNDEVKEDGYRYDAESARIATEYAGCFGIEL